MLKNTVHFLQGYRLQEKIKNLGQILTKILKC